MLSCQPNKLFFVLIAALAGAPAAAAPGDSLRVYGTLGYGHDDNLLLALALAAHDLKDVLRTASVRAVWAPRQSLQLGTSLAHQARSGSAFLGTGKFRSNSDVLDATVQF